MYCISPKKHLATFFFFISLYSFGQEHLTGYWQPQLAFNYKVSKAYAHNFTVANRNYVYKDQEKTFAARQIDVVHFSTFKTSFSTSFGAGVQYRFRKHFENTKENELRFTQQFNKTKKYRVVRIGNRFRTEQRITRSQTIHRYRYRFALDSPLMGQQLDVGEPYFIVTTEALLSIEKNTMPAYDQRFTMQIGWLLHKKSKLQFGIEHRFEDYTNQTKQVFFLLQSLVISL